MNATAELAPQEQVSPEDTPKTAEELFAEARQLLTEPGGAERALVQKAEALGLEPLEGFTSMAAQHRQDLLAQGHPLSDFGEIAGPFYIKAVAELFPDNGDPEEMLVGIRETVNQSRDYSTERAVEQATKTSREIEIKRRELQNQRAYDEVGTFGRHAGWVAARGGNGDLLVSRETPEALRALEVAGYKETPGGYESSEGPMVPFNNTPESTQDVEWVDGTGVGYLK